MSRGLAEPPPRLLWCRRTGRGFLVGVGAEQEVDRVMARHVIVGRATRPARRRTASVLAVVVVASTLGYVAVASEGTTVHQTDLHDAGVWVSSDAQAKFAKANVPIGQLESGVATSVSAGSGLDLLQDGAAVVGIGTGAGQLFPINPRTSSAGDAAAPFSAPEKVAGRFVASPVDLRGGTIALLDPGTGKLWAGRVDTTSGITTLAGLAPSVKPLAQVGRRAVVAVDARGTVHAVSGESGKVTTVPVRGAGFGRPTTVDTALRSTTPDITAVGTTWVAYDAGKDTLYTARQPSGIDAQVITPGGSRFAMLQQPGPDADTVALASADRASLVPLDGGAARGGVAVTERVNRVPGAVVPTRPVVLAGCLHAAWAESGQVFYGANCGRTGTQPTATLPAPGRQQTRDGVAFRVNRGLIVLNDLDNGGVWDLEDRPTKIDNWDALVPPTRRDDKNQKKDENLVDEATLQQPPKAEPDSLAVRPGRTSKLHVLDNDTDVAGSVLSIDQADVTRPSLRGVTASVSADGQAIDVAVPDATQGQSFVFSYRVGNGKAKGKGEAKVLVRIVGDDVNGAPKLRAGGAKVTGTTYPVITGKRLAVPVIADWRDPESDILAARAETGGSVVDGQGKITLTAPAEPGNRQIGYLVTDGRGGNTKGTITAQVLGATGTRFVPPTTQPDAVRGVVGKPLQIEPLGNDIAGADPNDPDAVLKLRSEVRGVGPLQVDADLSTGQVTVTGSAPGTFELTYAAQTGAGSSPGRIRVDLVAPPEGAPPVAVPDTATLHDQAPVLVDVLANDYSPRGDILVTASAGTVGEDTWLQPSIYQGRWVRIEAREPVPLDGGETGRRGVIEYTISDGTQVTTGQVAVLQQGELADAVPLVQDDTASVREGDTMSVPVLDNDTMADGIPLWLDPASVKVVSTGDEQRAFASGNVIRYVPEHRGLRAEKFVTIEYAAYADGMKARAQTARVQVQVTPLPSATRVNQAPAARSFSATVTAGDPLTMTVPTSGVDPDGDSVTVTGVVGADGKAVDLVYGRVVGIGPSTIRYEAFPLAAGTEVITYEVRDRFGATSQAFVRVGVVQPGDPQPPVAVPDEVFAAPGKTVTIRPLLNDLIARGDVVDIETEQLNDAGTARQWRLEDDNTLTTTVPADPRKVHQFTYQITNGVFDPSRASVLVRPTEGFVNPPVARDDVAAPKPGETVTDVDVLANDTDIDSDPATLEVVTVLSPEGSIEGGKVRVTILDRPHTVPYVIEDEDGAQAMAVIHVPTGANGQPFVVSGTLIQIDKDATVTVPVNDHVRSPRGRVVSVTTAETLSASPAENLAVSMRDNRTLTVTASGGYVGPAAVMLEVTDQDTVGQRDFGTAYVSIPVQVGPKVPLLRCPTGPVTVLGGGVERVLDIPTYCRAWLPVGMTYDDVRFESRWVGDPADARLEVGGSGGREIRVSADADARDSSGRLEVTADGAPAASTIPIRVVGAQSFPPPRLRPITVLGLEEGQSREIDVAPFLDSPLARPDCRIDSATVVGGTGLTASASGCRLTLTAGDRPSPVARVDLAVRDGAGEGRTAVGRATVTLLGAPSAPSAVSALADRIAGGQARVSWLPPQYDGGSAITTYTVTWNGGSQSCGASPCTITGLTNGTTYTFVVTATNAVGEGDPSAPSNAVKPDTLPQPVTGVAMAGRGDGRLDIAWDAPVNAGSALRGYTVRLISSTGQTKTQDVSAGSRRVTVTGLNNLAEQSVQVQARNELGAGAFGPAVTMQSAGTPPALPRPDIAASGPGPAQDSATLTISWGTGNPNGPPVTGYTLYRSVDGGGWRSTGSTGPQGRQARDVIPYDGRTYRYLVTVTNGAGLESPQANPATFTSVGQPSNPSVQTTTPSSSGRITVTVGVGQPRAGSFSAVRWQASNGTSGTYRCGCAPGSQVTFDVGPFDTSPTRSFTVTAWTVNGGGTESNRASGSAVPYGPTLTPTGLSGSRNGNDATWSWNLPENGRNIDQVEVDGPGGGTFGARTTHQVSGQPGQTYRVRVRSHSAAGWSAWTGFSDVAIPNPTPQIVNVRQGPKINVNNGSATCASNPCPRVDFDIRDFPVGGGGWTVITDSARTSPTTSGRPLYPTGSGNTYSWGSTGMVINNGNSPVWVRLCRNGTCYESQPVPWP
jgi:hypothetical protein